MTTTTAYKPQKEELTKSYKLTKETVPLFSTEALLKGERFFRRGRNLFEVTYVGTTGNRMYPDKVEYKAKCVAHDFGSKRYN